MVFESIALLAPVARTLLVLCAVGVFGLALGRASYRGVSLGIGGVLFAGLALGHWGRQGGLELDHAILDFVREFGLILFVYTIGIQVGPAFFTTLRRQGIALNLVGAGVVLAGTATAAAIHAWGHVPLPAVLGLLSGAVTNTPSLGAAQQLLAEIGAPASQLTQPGLGYAVAYPFGILGTLLVMLAVRTFLRIDPAKAAAEFEARRKQQVAQLTTLDVVLRREELDGVTVLRLPGMASGDVIISRILCDGRLRVPHDGTRVALGDVLHLVGPPDKLREIADQLGEVYTTPLTTKGTDLTWERLVVTNSHVLGRTIAALNIQDSYDVRISRVVRSGVELVATPALSLQFGDVLNVIGRRRDLEKVASFIGNSQQRLREFDPIPMFLGIALGLVLGSLDLTAVLGAERSMTPVRLGIAGGPLLAALALSRLGHFGKLVWFMPPIANLALRELGIVLFLAVVGYKSGGQFVETLTDGPGLAWLAWGAVITVVPLSIAAAVGRGLLKIDFLSLCGLLAGSMTDPPALAFANSMVPESQAPSLAYATVYPAVMCLRILSPQLLVLALGLQ